MPRVYRLAILQSHPIQYFAPLFRRLAQEPNIDLTVYYCSRQGLEEYTDPGFDVTFKWDRPLLDGYKHVFLPNLRQRDTVNGFLSLINPAVIGELRKGKYHALWVPGHNYLTYLVGMAVAKAQGIPIFMRCETHLLLKRSRWKRTFRHLALRCLYRQVCEGCLPIGTRNREFYLALGVSQFNLYTVPYAVDNDFFIKASQDYKHTSSAIRKSLGLPFEVPIILFASKLTQGKRPMDLLLAYEKLRNQSVRSSLLFIGSGSQETRLKDYVTSKGIPDVFFLGFQNQSELPKFYALADIFVLPSESEPWGLAINEAMCAGLPIVAAIAIGAVPDLVLDGHNGFIFETADVVSLYQHLQLLVEDEVLRKRLGENSSQIIARWSYEQCVDGVHEFLSHTNSTNFAT